MPVTEADITSRWVPADRSPNHAEVAETEVPSLYAVRGTYNRFQMIRLTAGQILELAERALDPGSELGRMLENGRRRERNGHHNGHRDRDRDRDARDRDARDRDRDRDARDWDRDDRDRDRDRDTLTR